MADRAAQGDPRRALARLVARLERRASFVTLADIERAATRRRTRALPPERVAGLVEAAVGDFLLLTDRRTFFDRATQTFRIHDVYRVNARHPLGREALER
jgi:hypothetical protein